MGNKDGIRSSGKDDGEKLHDVEEAAINNNKKMKPPEEAAAGPPRYTPREWLKQIREGRHPLRRGDYLSQRDVARRLGIAQQHYARFESPGVLMLDKHLLKLSRIFRIPVAKLTALEGGQAIPIGSVIANGGSLLPQQTDWHSRVPGDMDPELARVARIIDDSCEPRFREGEMVFYDITAQNLPETYYRDCIVALDSGDVLLRQVVPGTSARLVSLRGYDHCAEPINDILPKWLAPVRWVRAARIDE